MPDHTPKLPSIWGVHFQHLWDVKRATTIVPLKDGRFVLLTENRGSFHPDDDVYGDLTAVLQAAGSYFSPEEPDAP